MNREQLKKRIRGMPVTLATTFTDDMKLDLPRMKEMTHCASP